MFCKLVDLPFAPALPFTGPAALDNLLLLPKATQAMEPISGLKEVKMQMCSPGFGSGLGQKQTRVNCLPQGRVQSRCYSPPCRRPRCGGICTAARALSVKQDQVATMTHTELPELRLTLWESGEAGPRAPCHRMDDPVHGRLVGWTGGAVPWCSPGCCSARGGSGGQPFTLAQPPPFKECLAILRA